MGGLGDGIGAWEGKPVFVEKAAAGDVLDVRIIQQTTEFLRGDIIAVHTHGPKRRVPPCPYFSQCGGCSLQQLSENAYQDFKRRVLRDALSHAGFPDIQAEVIFLPAASRRRVELKWDNNQSSFAYYASRSRNLVPIENCLIMEPALQSLLPRLAQALGKWEYAAQIKTVSLTAADSGVDMAIALVIPAKAGIQRFFVSLADGLGIARISVDDSIVVSRAAVTMKLGDVDIALPPGAFLQASQEGQRLLTQAVVQNVGGAVRIADLFCGIGTYSFPLSAQAKVHAVENDAQMIDSLNQNAKKHGLKNLTGEKRDLYTAPLTAKELEQFDAVVINPPRPGAKAQCEQLARSSVKNAVMVSCSPASFARDAKILKNAGFSLTRAQAIDQFVYSPHLEIVAVFGR